MSVAITAENAPYLHRAMARSLALQQNDPQVLAACSTQEQRMAVLGDGRRTCIELVQAACEQYAERPCLAERYGDGPYTYVSYQQLWERVAACAAGSAAGDLFAPGDFVGIFGFASADWVVADLACLYRCAVSVPLRTAMAVHELAHVINQAALNCIFCGVAELPALVAVLELCPSVKSLVLIDAARTPDLPCSPCLPAHTLFEIEAAGRNTPLEPLVPGKSFGEANPLMSLCYTSGSTALPKGAMLTESVWQHTFTGAMFTSYPDIPGITFSYTPLNHIAGRNNTYRELHRGGTMYFAQKSDMSTLFDDLRVARPLYFMAVPRVAEMVYQRYQAECVRRSVGDSAAGQQAVRASLAHLFGNRLCVINTGTAPSSPEVLNFCRKCFDAPMVDGYGSTENGVVAFENHIVRPIIAAYKLRDVPELRYLSCDKPYPRGELCVRSSRVIPGYYKDPTGTARLFDTDGWMLTGDVVQERAPDQIVWIDRRHNILKLSNGEFVSASHLEGVFMGGSPFIEQMFVYVNGLFAYPLAVVVPNREAVVAKIGDGDEAQLKALILAEFARLAAQAGLQSFELPRDLLLEAAPFTQANGLLTESAKPSRPNLRARYGDALEALYRDVELRAVKALAQSQTGSTQDRLRHIAAAVLGVDGARIDLELSFRHIGGDSLAAVQLCSLAEQVCGSAPSMSMLLDGSVSLAALAQAMDQAKVDAPAACFANIHGADATVVRAAQLQLERFLPADNDPFDATPVPLVAKHILLTGATGFLGRFLLLDLLQAAASEGGHVTCLVRARNDAAAMQRLHEAYGSDDLLLAHSARLTVLAGDFSQPRLRLAAASYGRLAAEVDAVLHNGALVNHSLSYEHLFDVNVLGTVELMRFALQTRRKAFGFLSTTGVLNGLAGRIPETARAAQLWPQRTLQGGYANGYCVSKWACEVLLEQFQARYDMPVSIFRSGLIVGHRTQLGQINPTDFFTRLLHSMVHTQLAPQSFYKDAPLPFDALPVDFVAAQIAHLSRHLRFGMQAYNVVGPRAGATTSLDTIIDWVRSGGYEVKRVKGYPAWYTQFAQALSQLAPATRRASAWPIVHQWETPQSAAQGTPANDNFRAAVARHPTQAVMPPIDAAFIHQCLRHMQQLELI